MTIRNLNFLFAPQSIVLIVSSQTPETITDVLTRNIFTGGFKGEIFSINGKDKTSEGRTTYPDITSLPQTVDLAVIAAPPETVPWLIDQLGRQGTKAVVVVASGFSPIGEPKGQQVNSAMLSAAKPHLLRIIGPNSLGVMVPGVGLNGGTGHIQPLPGKLAFVSQSGAVLRVVLDWATSRQIGFSHCVSLGDMADVDFGDMLDYLANDFSTRAILLYMENISSPRKFLSAARAAARNKPVIVVKAGRHRENNLAEVSDCQTINGSDAIYDAVFRRAGILRVRDMQALFDAVQTLAMTRQVTGDRLTIVTNGGGIGVMAADMLIDRGGRLAELGQQSRQHLDKILPARPFGNPLEIVSDAADSNFSQILSILDHDNQTDAILVLYCASDFSSSTATAQAVINTLLSRRSTYRQKAILTCWLGDESAAEARRLFNANNIPTYATPTEAVRGFMQIVRYMKSQEMLMETPPSIPESFTPDRARARQILTGALAENRFFLTETETRALLCAYGIAVGDSLAKISSSADAQPQAQIHEFMIGMAHDAVFGPILTIGHGGLAAEVIDDKTLTLPPLNMHLAYDAITQTRVGKLLQGYSGQPGTALENIALTLIKVSQLVCDFGEIVELQLNPLLAGNHGVQVVKARIKVAQTKAAPADRLAILPYPKELEETLRLPDGQQLLIRPIRPEDEPNFQKIFAGMTPEEIRLRFLHPMNTMPHSLAARLTQIDYDREMSLVVEGKSATGQAELYGMVQITADPDKERAEFAIMLHHDMTGLGLGPMLLRRIIEYARKVKIGEVFGEVLSDNRAMLKLCRVFGFTVKSDREDPGIMQVCLKLKDSER